MASLMLKALFASNATLKANATRRQTLNATRRKTLNDFSCMNDCDNLWDPETMDNTQTLEKGKTYCFGFEEVQDDEYHRAIGTGFAILNGDDIDITTYNYQCSKKKSVKNIYAATTPTNEGRLFKLTSNKDQTIELIGIPATSHSSSLTYNGIKMSEKATIYLSLDTDTPHTIKSRITFSANNDQDYDCSYIYAADPNRFTVSAQNGVKSTAMLSGSFDGINTNGYTIQGDFSAKAGFIQAIPSEMVHSSTVSSAGTYTAESTITIKHGTTNLPGKYVEITPDTVFSKNDDEDSKSKTGLIVGIVIGVVVVVAIVVFCVYWFVCRTKSDDKDETPKV